MTRRQTPDGELVAGARGGDRRAFAALVERHYRVLVATCRRATGDAELAADAAQEAVVTALVGLDRLRDPERFVVLEEVGGERRLPIWIGTPEAMSLVAVLEEVELPRPGPYHFAQALLDAAGGALREVRVSRLADHVFYATAVLADGSEVDARPSDALTLALVTGAPIAVEPAVLDAAEHSAHDLPQLAAEVDAPADSASVLAGEVRARLAAQARELEELSERPAQP